MRQVAIMLGRDTTGTQRQLVKDMCRYLRSTNMHVQLISCAWHHRLWRWLTRKPVTLSRATEQDFVIGVGRACRNVLNAASACDNRLRLILIEPDVPAATPIPGNVRHALIFYDADFSGHNMAATGYMGPQRQGQTIEDYNLARRNMGKAPWIWQHIYRSRLAMNQWTLLNGQDEE